MKLTMKTLWIPTAILLVIFLSMGILFSSLITDNSEKVQAGELTQLIFQEKEKLTTGLSLITSTQTPADALIGLDGDDDALAKDLVSQVKEMGLNAIS